VGLRHIVVEQCFVIVWVSFSRNMCFIARWGAVWGSRLLSMVVCFFLGFLAGSVLFVFVGCLSRVSGVGSMRVFFGSFVRPWSVCGRGLCVVDTVLVRLES